MPLDGTKYKAPNVYDACADIITQRGHAKRMLQNSISKAVCLMGAFEVHNGNMSAIGLIRCAGVEAWDAFARGMGFEDSSAAIVWNNADERTQEEVVDRLHEAARAKREALIDAI